MISFRKKVFLGDLTLFVVFIIILFPVVRFDLRFLIFCGFILLLYALMTWALIYRLSTPIQKILDAILPYQEGRVEFLPRIDIDYAVDTDEFSKLALTLNSLREKIEKQISHLTYQKKETEGILQSLGEGVIAFDISGKVTFANHVSYQLLGIEQELILGCSLDRMRVRSEHLVKKCHELILQTLQTSETITATDQAHGLFLHLIAMPRMEQSGAILVIQDKTPDYKVVAMGKDFVANASHELKTPITIIRGFAETLQDIPNLSPKMRKEITDKIVRTCDRLNHLVKSLLTLADVENFSEDKFRPLDLAAIVSNCMHMLLSAYPQAQLSICHELAHSLVRADSELISLAIMNLLENAVRYSSSPAQIDISLQEAGSEILLTVRDQGIGIPEVDLPHIFDRFYTVDKARSRKSGGAGLGLSIVKTVIEKHKGKLKVSSELNRGSMFTIILNRLQNSL